MSTKDNAPGSAEALRLDLAKLFAHDMKNPVSAISANLSFLEAVVNPEETDMREAIEDTGLAARMLMHMIDNFLCVARLEAKEHTTPRFASVASVVEASLTRCAQLYPSGVQKISVLGDLPNAQGTWEDVYLTLALDNLILTSIHNLGSSGDIRISAQVEGDFWSIRVSDSGYPIAPEYEEQLFTVEFQSASKSAKGARYGRGLALYAVGLSTRFLGGTVTAHHADGRNDFVLRFPLNAA